MTLDAKAHARVAPPPVSTFPPLEDLFEYTPREIALACGVNEDTVTRCLGSRVGRRYFQKLGGRWVWESRDEATLVCVFIVSRSPKARRFREIFGESSETVRQLLKDCHNQMAPRKEDESHG